MKNENKKDLVEINIPFMGLYGTVAEDTCTLYNENDYYEASPELVTKMQEFDMCSDTNDCREQVAKTYAEVFIATLNSELTKHDLPPIPAEYSGMSSPREYNFMTDRLFVEAPRQIMIDYWHRIINDPELRDLLKKYLARTFTSHSGFISFYNNDIESWEERGPENFDCNEYGAIIAVLAKAFFLTEDWEFWTITEECAECKYNVSWGEKADKIRDEISAMQHEADNR